MQMKTKNIHLGLLLCIIVVLGNPIVNVVDVFPDFLAWFALAFLIRRPSDVCPYFDDAKSGARKLGFIALLRFFAVFITVSASGKDGDADTVALFAFSFGVIELIFLIPFLMNLFEGLFYLGERSDCEALIKPFGKDTPEGLQKLITAFFIIRAVASFMPEFLRLTSATDIAAVTRAKATYYAPVVVVCFVIVLSVGIYVGVKTYKFLKVIAKEGKFYEGLEQMRRIDPFTAHKKEVTKAYRSFFLLLLLASVFTVSLPFSDFNGMDIFPLFMFGLFAFFATLCLQSTVKYAKIVKYFALIFSAVSLTSYTVLGVFLKKYGYSALQDSDEAVSFYNVCRGLSIAESVFGVLLVFVIFQTVKLIIYRAMGASLENPHYSRADRDFHRSMMRKNRFLALFAAVLIVCTTVQVFLNGVVIVHEIDISRLPEGVTTNVGIVGGLFPAFGTIQTVLGFIFVYIVSSVFDTFKHEISAKAEAYS